MEDEPGTDGGDRPHLIVLPGGRVDAEPEPPPIAHPVPPTKAEVMAAVVNGPPAGAPSQWAHRPGSFDEATVLELGRLLEQYCGTRLSPNSGFYLERRLAGRLEALGLRDRPELYPAHVREHPDELELLSERLMSGETYFLREQVQLESLADEILPELAERLAATRCLRIWSAGCSTGEEAYSLAMLVHMSGLFEGWEVEILGTDIRRSALERAREAVYPPNSFRVVPPELRARYFVELEQERWRVGDELRTMCCFEQHNLLAADGPRGGPFDLLLCRNVQMYMSRGARTQMLEQLSAKLARGGYLLLGHSESLLHLELDSFELVHLPKDLVYRLTQTLTPPEPS